jgi:hypothetical protein
MSIVDTCRIVIGSYATYGTSDSVTRLDPACGVNPVAGLKDASAAWYIIGHFTWCVLKTFIFPFHCTLFM